MKRNGSWLIGPLLAALFAAPAVRGAPERVSAEPAGGVPVVRAEQAAGWVGKEAVVEGVVSTTKYLEQVNRQPTFLNFGEPHPNHCFTAVIFGGDRGKFAGEPPESAFLGKHVRVRGRVEDYRGKPEIIVRDPAQIEVVPEPEAVP